MATKKLSDKQRSKVDEIIGGGIYPSIAKDALDCILRDSLDSKILKAAKKELANQLKAIDKALAILCPPKKVEA